MIRKKHLKEGATVEQDGERMTLIKHAPSWRADDIPYCTGEVNDGRPVNFSYQRWLVDINGFHTHRHIHYFHSIKHLSANCDAWCEINHD